MYSNIDQGGEQHGESGQSPAGEMHADGAYSGDRLLLEGAGYHGPGPWQPLTSGPQPWPRAQGRAYNICGALGEMLDRPESSMAAQLLNRFIVVVILASSTCAIVESVPEMRDSYSSFFFPVEMCFTVLFTAEFALRLHAYDSLRGFMSDCFNIIDLVAILPGLMQLVVMLLRISESADVDEKLTAASSQRTIRMIRVVRFVRVCRVLRIAKAARHSQMLTSILAVFVEVFRSGLAVVLMLLCFTTILSASLVFLFESDSCGASGACSGAAADFESIPAAFWWAISTLTTVGYGDAVPQTIAGKIVGVVTAVTGMIVLAVGIALVSINFRDVSSQQQARAGRQRCGGSSGPEARAKDAQEVEELLADLRVGSSELAEKLRALVSCQDDKSKVQLLAMLDMLSKHTDVLSMDVQVFMRRLASLHDEIPPPRQ